MTIPRYSSTKVLIYLESDFSRQYSAVRISPRRETVRFQANRSSSLVNTENLVRRGKRVAHMVTFTCANQM